MRSSSSSSSLSVESQSHFSSGLSEAVTIRSAFLSLNASSLGEFSIVFSFSLSSEEESCLVSVLLSTCSKKRCPRGTSSSFWGILSSSSSSDVSQFHSSSSVAVGFSRKRPFSEKPCLSLLSNLLGSSSVSSSSFSAFLFVSEVWSIIFSPDKETFSSSSSSSSSLKSNAFKSNTSSVKQNNNNVLYFHSQRICFTIFG